MNRPGAAQPAAPRPVALCAALVVLAGLFAGLAWWQVQRLHWKEALIARVEAGRTAAPLDAERLPPGDLAALAYRRVRLTGRYIAAGTVLVSGASSLGSGYWVLTPLRSSGTTRYINRGFVPLGTRAARVAAQTPAGAVMVTGLLRLSEPGGGFLRANRPGEGRWYSRDVAAMARQAHLSADPRFFVDAEAGGEQVAGGRTPAGKPHAPVPGLTVISFPNNHLGYALVWAALALLSAGAAIMLWRRAP